MNSNLTRAERNLLKALRTSKNKDGFFEIIMIDYEIDKNNFSSFLKNFVNDNNVVNCMQELYFERKSFSSFRKQMKFLAQLSIQNKVSSGIATYDFIKNVAFVADASWVKSQMQDTPSKKMQTLYFFKKLENSLDKSAQTKSRILKEYNDYAKKPSKYINKLFSSDSMPSFITEDTAISLIKELQKSL